MHDSEEIPDDVPVADAVEQQRPVEPVPDEDASTQPPDDVPLEAAQADWQEQLETVELDPEFDEIERWPIEFLSSPTLLRDGSHCDDTDESSCLVHGVEREPNHCAGRLPMHARKGSEAQEVGNDRSS